MDTKYLEQFLAVLTSVSNSALDVQVHTARTGDRLVCGNVPVFRVTLVLLSGNTRDEINYTEFNALFFRDGTSFVHWFGADGGNRVLHELVQDPEHPDNEGFVPDGSNIGVRVAAEERSLFTWAGVCLILRMAVCNNALDSTDIEAREKAFEAAIDALLVMDEQYADTYPS